MANDTGDWLSEPLNARHAVQILTAFVLASNSGTALSSKARFLALDALECLQKKVR